MGERRCLHIGSQCADRAELPGLRRAATELHARFTDPTLGGCEPALAEGRSLVIDPDVASLRSGIRDAVARASEAGATLFVSFTGHGFADDSDFYLMALNSVDGQPDSALAVGEFLEELLPEHPGVDGLVLIIDACESGHVLQRLGNTLARVAQATGQRFEVLVSTESGPAYGCAFTTALAELLAAGDRPQGRFVTAASALPRLREMCRAQRPDHRVFDRGTDVGYSDPSLWLSLNPARDRDGDEQLADLLTWYQPTAQIDAVLRRLDGARALAVTAPAGQGKSGCAAALVHAAAGLDRAEEAAGGTAESARSGTPEHAPIRPRARRVDATAVITAATTPESLAAGVSRALERLPGYALAVAAFQDRTSEAELATLDALRSQVLGPLRFLGRPVVLVVDGLDQLAETVRDPVHDALDALVTGEGLDHVTLIVTARTGTRLPAGAREIVLGPATDAEIAAYLTRRRLPGHLHTAIQQRAQGNWLVARTFADVAEGLQSASALPATLGAAFDRAVDSAKARPAQPDDLLDAVLTVLAAAGSGPVLPLSLLADAAAGIAGPTPAHRVHDVLVRLRGLLVRAGAGTADERVGLFHAALAEHLSAGDDADDADDADDFDDLDELDLPDGFDLPDGSGPFGGSGRARPAALPAHRRIHVRDGHGALADALTRAVPHQTRAHGSQPFDYTLAAEPEHLWSGGRKAAVAHSLMCRTAVRPADNLARWRTWLPRLTAEFGPRSDQALAARNNEINWIEETGQRTAALELARDLAADCEAVLGPQHQATLTVRHDLVRWDDAGDVDLRLDRAYTLVRDVESVYGADHADTLGAEQTVAWLLGERDPKLGREHLERLLPRAARVLGEHDARYLLMRLNITYRLNEEERTDEAREALARLVPVMAEHLPGNHPALLTARTNLVAMIAAGGDFRRALALCKEDLAAVREIYGDEHHRTLTVRSNYVAYLIQDGGLGEAAVLARQLLADQRRTLGARDPATLATAKVLGALERRGFDGRTG